MPGCKNDGVRGNGLIEAPPAAELIKDADEEIIGQRNRCYDRGYDLEVLDANTKVSYGSVRAIFPFKPRDTVTRVAFRDTAALVPARWCCSVRSSTRACMPSYVRAEILRGTFIVQPVKVLRAHDQLHVYAARSMPEGILPAWLMNQLVAQDAVQLVLRLNTASATPRRNDDPVCFQYWPAPSAWVFPTCLCFSRCRAPTGGQKVTTRKGGSVGFKSRRALLASVGCLLFCSVASPSFCSRHAMHSVIRKPLEAAPWQPEKQRTPAPTSRTSLACRCGWAFSGG